MKNSNTITKAFGIQLSIETLQLLAKTGDSKASHTLFQIKPGSMYTFRGAWWSNTRGYQIRNLGI